MITIAVCNSLPEAYMIQSALRGSEIEAFLPDEMTAQNYWASIIAMGGIRVQVQDEDEQRAKSILEEFRKEEAGTDGTASP